MTGPEHYREAERLLKVAQDQGSEELIRSLKRSGIGPSSNAATAVTSTITAMAQAHATLALAAATAAQQATAYDGDEGYSRSRGWAGVA